MPRRELTGSAFGKTGIGIKSSSGFSLKKLPGKIWREMPHMRLRASRSRKKYSQLMRKMTRDARERGMAAISDVDISRAVAYRAEAIRLRSGKRLSKDDRAREFATIKASLQQIARPADEAVTGAAYRIVDALGGL